MILFKMSILISLNTDDSTYNEMSYNINKCVFLSTVCVFIYCYK
jgi:hypothetical protein